MNKYLKPTMLPLITLGVSVIGVLLRIWQVTGGTDEKGLLIAGHPAGILLAILTVLVLAVLLLGSWDLVQANKYRFNFPAYLPGCVGTAIAAGGTFINALFCLANGPDILYTVTGILGLLASVSLGFLSYGRLRGQQPSVIFHALLCLFLMVHLIHQYRLWSSEPQLQVYSYTLLATVSLMLSSYYSAAFTLGCGNRRLHTFFHLAAVYFCCLALIGQNSPGLYFALGCWAFTDLCSLRPMPRRFAREKTV